MPSHTLKYLAKRGEIYYFRLAIPTHLRLRFGCNELKASLHTNDRGLARRRCRNLSDLFENLFMEVPRMNELSQEQLNDIARSYFRSLLIEGNDKIFWAEEMYGKDPEYRDALFSSASKFEMQLRTLNGEGQGTKLFVKDVKTQLVKGGYSEVGASSDSYGILCGYFTRAQIESNRILQAKLGKEYAHIPPHDPLYAGIMDDTLPPLPEYGLGVPDNVKRLAGLVEKFKQSKKKKWAYKTQLDFERVLKWLIECVGADTSIQSIQTTDVGAFRDTLLKIPKNYNKTKVGKDYTLVDALALAEECSRISPRTADKYLSMAHTFFLWCESEGFIDKVPGQKIKIEFKASEKPKLPFTQQQLHDLFGSPIWAGCSSDSRRSTPGSLIIKDAYYWLPLLGAYTGMRGGEIIQLRFKDICVSEGIHYFDVNDDDKKTLKTKYSRRRIPVHPKLKEWGFMEFLAKRDKGKPEQRIFNEVSVSDKGDATHAYSKVFSRYLKNTGIKTTKVSFHSFRHSAIDALDNTGISEAKRRTMLGHTDNASSDKSASDQYGIGVSMPVLLEAISKMSYDFEKSFVPVPASKTVK